MLGEVGLDHVVGGTPCPNCNNGMRPGAVVCVKCGFNLQLGTKMSTIVQTEEDLENKKYDPLLHGIALQSHGNPHLDKAERDLVRDREMQKTLVQGAPWWMSAMGLVFVVGFSVMMIVIGPKIQQEHGMLALLGAAGGLFVVSTSVMCLLSFWLQSVTYAFHDSWLHCLLSFFYPPYALWYVGTRHSKVPQLMKLYLTGLLLTPGVGIVVVMFRAESTIQWVFALSAATLLLAYWIMIMSWTRVATHALEREPEPLHAILCCLFMNYYATVYGFLRWRELKRDTIVLLLTTIVLLAASVGLGISFAAGIKLVNAMIKGSG